MYKLFGRSETERYMLDVNYIIMCGEIDHAWEKRVHEERKLPWKINLMNKYLTFDRRNKLRCTPCHSIPFEFFFFQTIFECDFSYCNDCKNVISRQFQIRITQKTLSVIHSANEGQTLKLLHSFCQCETQWFRQVEPIWSSFAQTLTPFRRVHLRRQWKSIDFIGSIDLKRNGMS